MPIGAAMCVMSLSWMTPGHHLSPSVAHAQASIDEDQLFTQMITQAGRAYKEGRFRDAIRRFESAMLLEPNPNIHWNLAVCYHKVGDPQKALYHVNLYLERGNPSAKMRAKAQSKRVELLKEIKQRLDGGVPSVRPDTAPLAPPRPTTSEPDFNPSATRYDMTPSSSVSPQLSRVDRERRALLWGISSLGSLAIGSGVHLYADSIWAGRPSGGGPDAQDARRSALITSWTGDVFLVLGVASAVVAGVYYWGDYPSETTTPERAQRVSSPRPSTLVSWGIPVLHVLPSSRLNHTRRASNQGRAGSGAGIDGAGVDGAGIDGAGIDGAVVGWRLSFY